MGVRLIGGARGVGIVLWCVLAGWLMVPWCALAGARGYEMASPLEKGGDVDIGRSARAAASGGAVTYVSKGHLGVGVTRILANQFRSERSAVGWSTIGMNAPLDAFPGLGEAQLYEGVSPEADVGVARSWGSVQFGHPQMFNLWRVTAADGSFDLLTDPLMPITPEVPQLGVTDGSHFDGGSDDFSHVVFHSSRALLPDLAPEDQVPGQYLYEWADGVLRSVPVLPDDGGVLSYAALGYGPTSLPALYPGEYAVSANGSRIFFSSASSPHASGREIYLRSETPGGQVSVHVSASERTDCAGDPSCGSNGIPDPFEDPAEPAAQFQLASADGSRALFMSPKKLTDQATATHNGGQVLPPTDDYCGDVSGCDLFLWESGKPVGHRLTDLTVTDPDSGGVVGVVGASDDASRAYFVASGVLADGATGGEPNLYLWEESGGVRFIATLDASIDQSGSAADDSVWRRALPKSGENHVFRGTRVSGDGRFLVFRSRARVTEFDNAGHYQLYRYDAVTHIVTCVSCNALTGVSTGDAFFKRTQDSVQWPWLSRNVSSDGSVVFDSSERLVPADSNGKIDVYEWTGGGVRLISSGQSSQDSAFLDASVDGFDVFFTTRERLVGQDQDDLVDVYDARVDGGFPEPPKLRPCVGDACQGTPSAAPSFTQPSSSAVRANPKAPRSKKVRKARRPIDCKKGFARKRVKGKVRCVRRPGRSAKSRHGGQAR